MSSSHGFHGYSSAMGALKFIVLVKNASLKVIVEFV
jgi:hypothetical protein